MAIVGILASVLGAFFGSQTRISTDVQEGNELSIRLQRVAEALTQDLMLAGSRAVAFDDVVEYVPEVDTSCGSVYVQCGGEANLLTVVYASSLRMELGSTADVCRWVRYSRQQGNLYRVDTPCSSADGVEPSFAHRFAVGIDAVDLSFTCTEVSETGVPIEVASPEACAQGVRSGTVTVTGTSLGREARQETIELTVSMPNTRLPRDVWTGN